MSHAAFFFFFFNDTATTEIYTLSLHDALPILHNEVDSIERMRERLARLGPEARIAVAHGQMRERELERVMREFNAQRSNLLLCSTIIESGIDIPSPNTLVIHRADKVALAQPH